MHPRTSDARSRDERGVVAPSRLMLVAIVVVAIGAAMFFATSPGSKDDAKPAASTKPSTTSSPASTPASTAPATPSPSAEPSSEPATPTPSASPKPSTKPSATATASGSVDKAGTQVAVFNNTRRKGLAERTASKVTAAGWKVTGTDNWRGNVPATTVYYPKGMQAAAKSLAADLGIDRVKAAQSPMRNDRLTVILT